MILRGEKVRLRPLARSDLREYQRIGQDEETVRWVDPSGLTPERAQEIFDEAEALWREGKEAVFAVTPTDSDALVGTINLHFYDSSRASIGYGVAPETRGRGVATEALKLLSGWAFTFAPDLVRLELWIVPGNDASVAVAERAGFYREGVFRSRYRFGDEFRDVVVYSLVRSDLTQ